MHVNPLPITAYPALYSKRTMRLIWALIAALTVGVVFAGKPPFLPEGFGTGEHMYSDNLRLIALMYIGLGYAARTSKRPQKRLIRQLERRHGKIRPTWKAAVEAGNSMIIVGGAILAYYGTQTIDTLVWLIGLLLSA